MPRPSDFSDALRRRFERASLQALVRLPRPVLVRFAGGKRIRSDGDPLDEQVQLMLMLAQRMGHRPTWQLSVADARAEIARGSEAVAPDPIEMAEVSTVYADGEAGALPMRMYRPRALRADSSARALVWVHGGGFVTGDLDVYDAVCRQIADATPTVVLSVDYRLAPEHKFPAAVNDVVAAMRTVHARASSLGVDPERIMLGGDSAGGNLSAVASRLLRNEPARPAFQLLVYPATDMTCSMESHRLFSSGFFLESKSIEWFRDNYLRTPDEKTHPDASPLFADDLSGLPPAMVIVAGFDPLRDEGLAYAEKMRKAGVRVAVRNDTTMFHGYFSASGAVERARHAVEAAAAAMRDATA